MTYDGRQDHLRKDLGITWTTAAPAAEQADTADVSEEKMLAYRLECLAQEKSEREQQQALEEHFSGKNADQIRDEYEQKLAEEAKAALPEKQIQAVHQFLVDHPEFVCSPLNQRRIDQYFEAAGLDGSSPEHFSRAFTALQSRGLVAVNEYRRPRQPRRPVSTRDLYDMPIEELRSRANQEMRKR